MTDVTLEELRPTGACPACGTLNAFVSPTWESQPSFDKDGYEVGRLEWLAWRCVLCGYPKETKTVEQAR